MNKIDELILKLKKLPSGYISEKTISNNRYYYLKYYEEGKQKSKYIKTSDIDLLKKQLAERKKIEDQIKKYENTGRNISNLSNSSLELTGSIMCGDKKVAVYNKGSLLYINEELCPLLIKRTNNLSSFLKGRSIDSSRTNSRLLKKVLNINNKDDEQVSLYVYGAVITDNYWFKPRGSKLKYKDIIFEEDYYCDLALKGEITINHKKPKHSPQISTIGSFEKCWKKIDNEWWLYKKGTKEQIFSEIFCSLLAFKLGIPTVIYEYDYGFIRSKNFASKYNFDPMIGLLEEESYDSIFNKLIDIDIKLADQYLLLSFFDCVVNNIDRHNENLGFLRDRKNGKIVSLAPNFDNNLALLGFDKRLIMDASHDGFISLFLKFLKTNKKAFDRFKKLKIEKLNKQTIEKCISQIPIKINEYDISKYLMNRYEYIIKIKNK